MPPSHAAIEARVSAAQQAEAHPVASPGAAVRERIVAEGLTVPATYVGQSVEVQWGAGETVQIYHQGTLIATHPRAHDHHQRCVELAHYAMLRRPVPPAGATQSSEPVRPTRWPGALPEVAVRELAVYATLLGAEVFQD